MRTGVVARRRSSVPITYEGAGAVDSAVSAGNLSLPYPAPAGGILTGDFLWIPLTASVATVWASNAIAGFTRRFTGTSGGSSPTVAGFYRIATGGESGSVTANSPGGSSIGRMYVYRGVDPTTPFDVADALFGSGTAVTDYVIPTQTPTVAECAALLIADGNSTTGSWTPPGSHTELLDSGNAEAQVVFHGHRLGLPAGPTGTRTVVRSGSTRGAAAGVILRPAA